MELTYSRPANDAVRALENCDRHPDTPLERVHDPMGPGPIHCADCCREGVFTRIASIEVRAVDMFGV